MLSNNNYSRTKLGYIVEGDESMQVVLCSFGDGIVSLRERGAYGDSRDLFTSYCEKWAAATISAASQQLPASPDVYVDAQTV